MPTTKNCGQCPPYKDVMSQYVRANQKGGTFFFTLVTYQRRKILIDPQALASLRESIIETRRGYPFKIGAWVLLPDHMHCIWTLPKDDYNYSKRWGLIKAGFSRRVEASFHRSQLTNMSKRKHRESTIWQRRFWEHTIRDEDDFIKHMDYVHYNPVKHGLVQRVKDWQYSSFHRHVAHGAYDANWGSGYQASGEFGE